LRVCEQRGKWAQSIPLQMNTRCTTLKGMVTTIVRLVVPLIGFGDPAANSGYPIIVVHVTNVLHVPIVAILVAYLQIHYSTTAVAGLRIVASQVGKHPQNFLCTIAAARAQRAFREYTVTADC